MIDKQDAYFTFPHGSMSHISNLHTLAAITHLTTQFGLGHKTTAAELREFMATDHAYYIWVRHSDGMFSRGNPGKVPYMVIADPNKLTHRDRRYWEHYRFPPVVPIYYPYY